MNIKLLEDSRDSHAYKHFGQISIFPDTENYDDPNIPEAIQAPGDVECTCYTVLYLAQNKTKVKYDMQDLWNRIPHDSSGADPRTVLGEVVNNGLLPIGATERVKPFSSYFRADTGKYDAFDNCRSAMLLAESPIAIWCSWYREWLNLPPNAVMPLGVTPVSGHMFAGKGWVTGTTNVNGVPMLIIEWWGGQTNLMPRETLNSALNEWGCGSAVLSTDSIDAKREKTLWETLRDLYINFVLILMKQKMNKIVDNSVVQTPTTDIVTPMETPSQRLYDLAMKHKGEYLTLDTTVPKTLNCAETISWLLKECGYPIPARGFQGTNSIDVWLSQNCDVISAPDVGDIIISITQGNNHGHIGACGHNAILSNDSQTGTLESYWSLSAWLEFYQKQKGLVTKFYKLRE